MSNPQFTPIDWREPELPPGEFGTETGPRAVGHITPDVLPAWWAARREADRLRKAMVETLIEVLKARCPKGTDAECWDCEARAGWLVEQLNTRLLPRSNAGWARDMITLVLRDGPHGPVQDDRELDARVAAVLTGLGWRDEPS